MKYFLILAVVCGLVGCKQPQIGKAVKVAEGHFTFENVEIMDASDKITSTGTKTMLYAIVISTPYRGTTYSGIKP